MAFFDASAKVDDIKVGKYVFGSITLGPPMPMWMKKEKARRPQWQTIPSLWQW